MNSDPLAVRTLCEAFQQTVAADPDAIALRTLGGGVQITWAEYGQRVRRIAAGLHRLGVGRQDTIGLMMVNRPEFNLCDTAALHLGAVPFSLYNTLPTEQITQLFANAENRVVICEEQFAARVLAAPGKVEHIVCVDGKPDGTMTLGELEELGDSGFDFDAAWRAVGPHDALTLIYTSGTTGAPKGVELTHANMLAEMRASTAVLPVERGDRILSYLPSAHIADRWTTHYQGLAFGLEVTCVPDPRAVVTALAEVRPTVWGSVPRIWEKMKAALEARFTLEPDPARRAGLAGALEIGLRKVRAEQAALAGTGPGPDADLLAEYARADDLVFSKIRHQLGLDQVRWSVSGAAPAPVDVLEFFAAIGLPVCELWGMSELSGAGTVNRPTANKIGTVGPALPGVDLKLAADGELLCRGPIVMRGYRKEPDKTADTIDDSGWLHTGDIAEIDADGYVRIVDRKKELIINAYGKNLSPANIEAKLKAASPLIGQAVAVGDQRPYTVALIVLDPDACSAVAQERGLSDPSPAALSHDPVVVDAIDRAVAQANGELSRVEQVKAHAILPTDWEPAGDELTPTMKLKRRAISQKYAPEIDRLYGSPAPPPTTASA
jgi:long-subunit acyl-CoA synthetase (AMP-forming)